jgi:hypothetical protein
VPQSQQGESKIVPMPLKGWNNSGALTLNMSKRLGSRHLRSAWTTSAHHVVACSCARPSGSREPPARYHPPVCVPHLWHIPPSDTFKLYLTTCACLACLQVRASYLTDADTYLREHPGAVMHHRRSNNGDVYLCSTCFKSYEGVRSQLCKYVYTTICTICPTICTLHCILFKQPSRTSTRPPCTYAATPARHQHI